MHPTILLMCVKFEGNQISCLHVIVIFAKCVKNRKGKIKPKKTSNFLKVHISGIVGNIYTKF